MLVKGAHGLTHMGPVGAWRFNNDYMWYDQYTKSYPFGMMTSSNGSFFSALLAFCVGNSPVTGEIPSQKPVTELWCFLWSVPWINVWVNNREAGDLRRHRAPYNVIVLVSIHILFSPYHSQFSCDVHRVVFAIYTYIQKTTSIVHSRVSYLRENFFRVR